MRKKFLARSDKWAFNARHIGLYRMCRKKLFCIHICYYYCCCCFSITESISPLSFLRKKERVRETIWISEWEWKRLNVNTADDRVKCAFNGWLILWYLLLIHTQCILSSVPDSQMSHGIVELFCHYLQSECICVW